MRNVIYAFPILLSSSSEMKMMLMFYFGHLLLEFSLQSITFSKNISNSFWPSKRRWTSNWLVEGVSDKLWYFSAILGKPVLDITLMDGSKTHNGQELKGAMKKSDHDISPIFLSCLPLHKRMVCQRNLHYEICNCSFI